MFLNQEVTNSELKLLDLDHDTCGALHLQEFVTKKKSSRQIIKNYGCHILGHLIRYSISKKTAIKTKKKQQAGVGLHNRGTYMNYT